MNIRTHGSSFEKGTEYTADDLVSAHLPADVWHDGIYASDMDQTMVLNDTGALVFIEYLNNPDFYRFSREELYDLLIPDRQTGDTTPRAFIAEGAAGNIDGVSADDCREALRLRDAIVESYGNQDNRTECIRLIMEFDSLLIRLKNQHPCSATSNLLASAFSRFRLFSGLTPSSIQQIAGGLLNVRHDDPARYLAMRAGDSAVNTVDRVIQVNDPVHALLDTLHTRDGAEGVVVTATPADIAMSIIRGSAYATLVPDTSIIATKLERTECGTYLSGRLDGPMVAGIGKTQALEKLAADTQRRIRLALGDLPGSDAHMGAMALRNNGVFVIAHHPDHFEQSRQGFGDFLGRILGKEELDKAKERIWYIPTRAQEQISGGQR